MQLAYIFPTVLQVHNLIMLSQKFKSLCNCFLRELVSFDPSHILLQLENVFELGDVTKYFVMMA